MKNTIKSLSVAAVLLASSVGASLADNADIRVGFVPKFLKDDIPLFENIIIDLFPGIDRPEVDYGNLESAIT